MLKKYYYELNSENRILWIDQKELRENSFYIELESLDGIEVWYNGIVDSKIVVIEELKYDSIITETYAEEIKSILKWLSDNDYKINKHILGEYSDNDERWVNYLTERQVKLSRYNQLEVLMNQ
jgi:hypothetical protein